MVIEHLDRLYELVTRTGRVSTTLFQVCFRYEIRGLFHKRQCSKLKARVKAANERCYHPFTTAHMGARSKSADSFMGGRTRKLFGYLVKVLILRIYKYREEN